MKKLFRKLIFIGAGVVLFASCKKDQSMEYFNGGTAPVISSSVTGTIPLSYANGSQNAITFSWTNPNYMFTSGVNSQDVSYLMEIDTLGANFTNPNRLTQTISKDLGVTFTQSAFNAILLNQMFLLPGLKHTLQVRITSSISSVTATNIASNVLQFSATPYQIPPAVTPPSTGTLFIVGGDPLLGGWSNSVPSKQQFTKVSTTEYYVIVPLSGGDPTQSSDQYSVTSQNGTWNGQFGVLNANLKSQYSLGGSFNANGVNGVGTNFPGPVAAGTYKIDLDFQHGIYTVTKQ